MYSINFSKNNFLIKFSIFFLLLNSFYCNPLPKEQNEAKKSTTEIKNDQDLKTSRTARSNSKIEFVYLDTNGNVIPKQNLNIKSLLANNDNDLSIDPKNRNSDKSILINKDIDGSIDKVIQITSYNNDKPDDKPDDLHYSAGLKQNDHLRHKSKFNHDKPIVIPIKVKNENTFSIPPFVNSEFKNSPSSSQSLKMSSENQPSVAISQPFMQENYQNPFIVPSSYPIFNNFLDYRSLSHPYVSISSPYSSQSASDQYLNYPSVYYPVRNNLLTNMFQFSPSSLNRVLDNSIIYYNNVDERLINPFVSRNYFQNRPITAVIQPTSFLSTPFINPLSNFLLPQQTPSLFYYQDFLNNVNNKQFGSILTPTLNSEFSGNLALNYQQYLSSLINGKKVSHSLNNSNEVSSPFVDTVNPVTRSDSNAQNFEASSLKIPDVLSKSNDKPLFYSNSRTSQIMPNEYIYNGGFVNRYLNQPYDSQSYYYRYSQPVYDNRYQSYYPYYNSYVRPVYNENPYYYNPTSNFALQYSAEKPNLNKKDQVEIFSDDKKNVDDLLYTSMNIKDLLKEKSILKNNSAKNISNDEKKN